MKYSHLIVSVLSIGLASTFSWAITAFPGALGFGNAATGGRGGTVYHVTNLDDSGTGSFRDAVSKSSRIVVFDVSGYIQLKTAVSISSNITIAGQTAPGEGIGIRGGEISCANQTNIIIRYLRVRPGSETASTEDDALSLYLADNVILDHCSFEFAPWNNIDGVGNSSKKLVTNISFQYCLIANPTGQQFGAHCESVNSDWSWYYNAFVNSHNRNPLAKVNDVFVNNVLYDNEASYTTHTSTNFKHDIVNNYFIYGPKSSNNTWYQIDRNQSIYYSGNLLDNDKDGTLGGAETTPYWYQGTGTVLTAPWSAMTTANPIYSTKTAFRLVTSQTGDLPYDDADSLIWSQVNSLGKTGTLYTTQVSTGLANNGYGVINSGTKPTDTDGDGMPDYWELAMGTNSAKDDAMTLGSDGYAYIENYINWLGAQHATALKNGSADIDLRTFTSGFQAVSPSYTASNAKNGTVTVSGYTAHFTPASDFTGLASFSYTVKGTDGTEYTGSVSVLVEQSNLTSGPSLIYKSGSLEQIITLGTAMENVIYRYSACTGVKVTGLPAGVTSTISTADSTVTISGTPTAKSSSTYTITTVGGNGNATFVTGSLSVTSPATVVNVPSAILSSVNAAFPASGDGFYEEKNTGWIDSGYFNLTNSVGSSGLWNLNATQAASGATLVIRFANGGTAARGMNLEFNGSTVGSASFATTGAWTTWDSLCVKVDIVAGKNTLSLQSLSADGGPNLDQFGFDVAGVTLYKTTATEDHSDSTDTTDTESMRLIASISGVSFDLQNGVLETPAAGFAEVDVFDVNGSRVAHFGGRVSAGATALSLRMPGVTGVYMVRVRMNGQNVALRKVAHTSL